MQAFLIALFLSALPVVSNFIGAMIAEALPLSKRTLGLALHAAAGVLLAIASVELLPRVVAAKPVWPAVLALLVGGISFIWVNRLLHLSKNRLRGIDNYTVSWVIFFSIAIDLLGDGLMIGTSLTIDTHLGISLASARVIAHIPEGFVTNASFKSQAIPKSKRFLLLSAFIIPVWLGTILGYWGLRGQPELLKIVVLAFTTGTLLTAVVEEILPEAHQALDTDWSMVIFISSFALSTLFSTYLG